MSNVVTFPVRPDDPAVALFRRACALQDKGRFDEAERLVVAALEGRFRRSWTAASAMIGRSGAAAIDPLGLSRAIANPTQLDRSPLD